MKSLIFTFFNYRAQQVLIFLLHLVLLYWIYFLLGQAGTLSTKEVLYHFLGASIFGSLLIRGCAAWGKHHHLKNQK
jgi:hypothetical protein